MRRFTVLALVLSPLLSPAYGEEAKKPMTLERITANPPLAGKALQGGKWRDSRRFTWIVSEGSGPDAKDSLFEIDAETGKIGKVLDAPRAPSEGANGKEPKAKALPLAGSVWSPAGDLLLLNGENDLFVLEVGTGSLRRLTRDDAAEEYPVFSPDGTRVAFVRKNDLFAVEVRTGKETRLTATGADDVLNGKLDWVYEEELASRRSGRSFEWAPDSRSIAYLSLDDTGVPEFPIVDFLPVNGKLLPQRYPKAGDPNPIPSVHVVGIDGVETASASPGTDLYVAPEVSWTADGRSVAWLALNRAQTRLEVRLLSRTGGASRTLLVEEDPAWINAIEPPRFLKDGSFLFLSERSGFLHLYRHGADGRPIAPVTTGTWMVDRAWEVSEKRDEVLFAATEKDPRERHVYRVRLDGSGLTRITREGGTHVPVFAPGGTCFVDTFSDLKTPPKSAVVRSDGTIVAAFHEQKGELDVSRLGSTELRSFRAEDGTLLYARLVKPAAFDPARKYPVVVSVYGGPHAQVVQDRWGATSLFEHLLAERGFLVWSVDNRGSWGRGHAFETALLKRTGETELRDQLDGIAELKRLPFVDGSRIGISGWSYGGYMTLYAATHAGEMFRCAVAGAPVTDWKYYDSIYTERYLKLPKENAEGYRASSAIESAGNLGTRLLLIHGTSDDNVHMQQTVAFVDALMRSRKDYELVLLPRQKHGPRDPAVRLYVNQRILEFFERNLASN